jgi:hypothetical protein
MSILELCQGLMHHLHAPGGLREDAASYGAGDTVLHNKFRHWRGRSGRAYVFSAYAAADCPPYENAVLIVTARRDRESVLACLDLGAFPESRLAKIRRRFSGRLDEFEFQIHVLAEREGERRLLIDDLTPATA